MARGKRPDPRYLRQRGNVWFFQKRLSPTFSEHLGKKVFQQTTNTGDLDEACRVRDRLLADLSDLEAELKGQASTAQRRQLFLNTLEKLRAAHAELQQQATDDGIPLDITDVLDPERLSPVERDALVAVSKASPPAQYRLSLRATLEDWTNSPLVERKPTTVSKNTRSVELFLSSVKLEVCVADGWSAASAPAASPARSACAGGLPPRRSLRHRPHRSCVPCRPCGRA